MHHTPGLAYKTRLGTQVQPPAAVRSALTPPLGLSPQNSGEAATSAARPLPTPAKRNQTLKLRLTLAPLITSTFSNWFFWSGTGRDYLFITHYVDVVFLTETFFADTFSSALPLKHYFFMSKAAEKAIPPQTFTNEMKENRSYVTLPGRDAPLYFGLLKHKPPCDWLEAGTPDCEGSPQIEEKASKGNNGRLREGALSNGFFFCRLKIDLFLPIQQSPCILNQWMKDERYHLSETHWSTHESRNCL